MIRVIMDTKFGRRVNIKLLVALLMLGATASEPVLAHGRGGVSIGVGIGFGAPFAAYPFYRPYYSPFYSPFYYPPAYYPPVVVVPPAPPVYIEQSVQPAYPQYSQPVPPPVPQAAPQSTWWYYCPDSQSYYPYVKQCPAGWQQVTPQTPG